MARSMRAGGRTRRSRARSMWPRGRRTRSRRVGRLDARVPDLYI